MKNQIKEQAMNFNFQNGKVDFERENIRINLVDPRYAPSNSWTYQLLEKMDVMNQFDELEQDFVIVKEAQTIEELFD